MDTSKIKTYAPQARKDFIQAVTERANLYGIFGDEQIEEMKIKGDVAIIGERAFPKSEGELRESLVRRIKRQSFEVVIRATAYTWFNRFAALRYMELHQYLDHGFRVLSHPEGLETPQILEHAAELDLPGLNRNTVAELKLAGNKDNELYRLVILAQCSALHKAMPFLFEAIDTETALLLPDNLLHTNSPVCKMVTAIDEGAWQEVEIIGWLYQHYISERKDQVIGKVVQSEDIPAATQLFTPNWIVKYMVQNTLGRMWLATYPDSPLRDKMEYYIEPAEQEPEVQQKIAEITPVLLNPEEITFLDPACGSGHILVEAYTLFKEIYLERGYRTRDIPKLILGKNLYGLDIDDRAAQLAGFAVLMKAREDDRRVLGRESLDMNIMAIQEGTEAEKRNIELFFKGDEHARVRADLNALVELFKEGKTFGSLISIPEKLAGRMEEIKRSVEEKIGRWWFGSGAWRVTEIVAQAGILSKQYDCVVTNPPYMGNRYLNIKLKKYLKSWYDGYERDLFSAMIAKCTKMGKADSCLGFMAPFVWMFISTYEKLRIELTSNRTLNTLVQLEYSGFTGATVPICTFTFFNKYLKDFISSFVRLTNFRGGDKQPVKTLEAIKKKLNCEWYYQAKQDDFKKIHGRPISYWVNNELRDMFEKGILLQDILELVPGMDTGKNAHFLRIWSELSNRSIAFDRDDIKEINLKTQYWIPCNKGGDFRKWYGNNEYVINWRNEGRDLHRARTKYKKFYLKPGITWTYLSSSFFAVRSFDKGYLWDRSGSCAFEIGKVKKDLVLALLCSKPGKYALDLINPTLNYQLENIKIVPFSDIVDKYPDVILANTTKLVFESKKDWNSFETSWDFRVVPLLESEIQKPKIELTYEAIRNNWQSMTTFAKQLEEENNRIFIGAYNLQDELTPEVPLSEITLTCNPHYRYGANKSDEELETLLRTDTIKELISYAVGCMMGRYSLDEPGLIYALAGNEGFDPSKYINFPADEDGIVPIMDQDWVADDATNRLVEFIKVAWPAEHLEENLVFIAENLNPKAREEALDTIRRYMSTTFFKDHLKTYKKRPIYWLFSSGKQKAFECLVYLHRYNSATLSRMRSLYVTPLQGNFIARLDYLAGQEKAADTTSTKNKIRKEIAVLKKKQSELSAFDEQLRHYADMRIEIDLDDGAKINYTKFGMLLAEIKAVTGE